MNVKPLPPPPSRAAPPPATTAFSVTSGRLAGPQRVLLYGPGGIGKSSLAALAPVPVFLDLERGTREIESARRIELDTWTDLRACLQSPTLDGFSTVVLDTATRAEALAVAHTLATVPHEKGHRCQRTEDYGFGKGLQHIYETFDLLLSDLDRQVAAGRNVIVIAHDCVSDAPNPGGDNFIRYEPHLQSPKSGKGSIRNRVVQWADHVLFLGYDVISKDGKGRGSGTRTIHPTELPSHVAKSRILAEPMQFIKGEGRIWKEIIR